MVTTTSLRGAGAHGWIASVELAGGRGLGFREIDGAGLAGYVVSLGERRVRGDLALELGAGLTTQHRDAGGSFRSAAALAVPSIGLSAAITDRLGVRAQAQLAAMVLERDRRPTVLALPSALFGVVIGL